MQKEQGYQTYIRQGEFINSPEIIPVGIPEEAEIVRYKVNM